MVGHDKPFAFVQGHSAGEEARRVPVGAHAKQHQVEARRLPGGCGWIGRHQLAHGALVGDGGSVGIPLAGHAEDQRRRSRQAVEQSGLGHGVVALRRGGWHAAFVAPEYLPPGEIHERVLGQQAIDRLRCGAASQRDAEEAAPADRCGGRGRDDLARYARQVVGSGENFDGASAFHSVSYFDPFKIGSRQ